MLIRMHRPRSIIRFVSLPRSVRDWSANGEPVDCLSSWPAFRRVPFFFTSRLFKEVRIISVGLFRPDRSSMDAAITTRWLLAMRNEYVFSVRTVESHYFLITVPKNVCGKVKHRLAGQMQVRDQFLLTSNHIFGSCCLPLSAIGENIQILWKINSKPMSYPMNYLISRALRLAKWRKLMRNWLLLCDAHSDSFC